MGNHNSHESHTEGKAAEPLIRRSSFVVSGRYFTTKKLEDDYTVLSDKVLGTGMNGSVLKAVEKSTRNEYAVKAFKFANLSKQAKEELMNEAEIFLSMDHPHVARLIAVYESAEHLHLVMECMEGGELFDRVVKKKKYAERDAAHSMWQMLLAVHYLHSREVVHRDLKLENFLYEKVDNDHLKLIDFGFSKVWDTNTKMAASCGTLSYVAPEVLEKSYTKQCDLWSLGVVCFILTLGYMPFAGAEKIQIENIKKGKYVKKEPQWGNLSAKCQDFILKLLVVDSTERMTTEQALKHEWIAERDQGGRYHITPLAHLDSSGDIQSTGTMGKRLNVEDNTIDALCNFAQASRFRKACMSLMAWSLTQQERAAVRDRFIELDVKRQGTISLAQLQEVLKRQFSEDDERLKPLLESLSASSNEEIHYSEFLAGMITHKIAMNDQHILAVFKRFDIHNEGFITQASLKQILGDQFKDEELVALIASVDPENKDKISYKHFVEYLKSGSANQRHTEVAEKIIEAERVSKVKGTEEPGDDRPQRVVTNVHNVRSTSEDAPEPVVPEPSKNKQNSSKSRTCALL